MDGALTRFAIADNRANREHLLGLVAKWRPLADEIVETGSRLLGFSPAGSSSAGPIATAVTGAWRDFLEGAGLQIE
jgi:hypothetical protein